MATLTKLDAVNIILSNVGQAPMAKLDTQDAMVQMAANILDEVSEAIQSEGWAFNYEPSYPFVPNTDNEILVPPAVIRLSGDPYGRYDVVIRRGKLYDKRNHTYKFNVDQLDLDVTWLLDFEDMPQPAKQYAAVRAANLFAGRAVGSQEAVKFGEREEMMARASLIDYETDQGDYSILGTEKNQKIQNYAPFSVINR